jgi:Short C-terminal domain
MRGRKIGATALLVVGTLLWTVFGFALWAKRQALDTDQWVETSTNLLEDEEIRTALGLFIVDRLFDSAEVEEGIEDALPDRLDRLAGPAAAGLKEAARRNAPRLLGTEVAVEAWSRANEAAHSTLLAVVEGGVVDREVALDLKSLFAEVADGTGLPPAVADRLPEDVASLQIADGDQLETAQDMLDLFETLVWVLLLLSLAAFAGAIALSPDRRRAVIQVGFCLMFAAVAVFAIRRLAGDAVIDALAEAPNAQGAADDVWEIGTSVLVAGAAGSFVGGLLIVSCAWLAGPGRRATALRRVSAHAMRERPGLVRAALGTVILLLVIWGPVPFLQRFWTIVVFTVAMFVWLEWIRRRTLEEFPDQPPPRLRPPGRRSRSAELERLASLRERGVLSEAEFEREKAALLASG